MQLCQKLGRGFAELRVVRRQGRGGDDLALAEWFTIEVDGPRDDEVWARVASGRGDGRARFVKWEDEQDLTEKISELLANPSVMDPPVVPGDENSLRVSLGAIQGEKFANYDSSQPAKGVEAWQILSPVRHLSGGVVGINDWVRRTYRPYGIRRASGWGATEASPAGPDRATCGDKVLVTQNMRLLGSPIPKGSGSPQLVANGEVGVLDGPYCKPKSKKPAGHNLYTSTQPDFRFWLANSLFGGDYGDVVRLGYAITIHKAQGSQFGTVFVVLPDPCPLTGPELVYTALTRQRHAVVVLHQGDLAKVRALGSGLLSATASRLTNLFDAPDPMLIQKGEDFRRWFDARRVHRTDRDELVLSKSEVIVANALHAEGIDYLYEEPLDLGDGLGEIFPDFTVEDKATGETWYIEHAGMLDDPVYRRRWERKLERYRKAGIVPETEDGGRLVVTDERQGIHSAELREKFRALFG